MFIFPIGLIIFGWTAQAECFFLIPLIGAAIFAFGLMLTFNSIQVSSFLSHCTFTPSPHRLFFDSHCELRIELDCRRILSLFSQCNGCGFALAIRHWLHLAHFRGEALCQP